MKKNYCRLLIFLYHITLLTYQLFIYLLFLLLFWLLHREKIYRRPLDFIYFKCMVDISFTFFFFSCSFTNLPPIFSSSLSLKSKFKKQTPIKEGVAGGNCHKESDLNGKISSKVAFLKLNHKQRNHLRIVLVALNYKPFTSVVPPHITVRTTVNL